MGRARGTRVTGLGQPTQQQRPPPFCPAGSPMPRQILTRSLGRRASPGPFLLPSGAGTLACRRGSGPGGRQSAWARPGCAAGARAPCLAVPSLPRTAAVPTCGQESPPSQPGRQEAAGAQPTPHRGLGGRRLCAMSPPSPGHRQGHRVRPGAGHELLGLCSASSILPWLRVAEQHLEHPLHCGAASLGKGVLARGPAGLGKEDTASRRGNVGKGSCSVGTRGGWLAASPTYINELLLLLLRHLTEPVVPSRQVSGEAVQRLHCHLLHLSPLGTGAGWRQAQPTDAAPSPHPGREHIALVEVAKLYLEQTGAVGCLQGGAGAGRGPVPKAWGSVPMHSTAARLVHLGGIQVCDVLHGAGVVSVVPLLNHGVKQVCKHLKARGTMCGTAHPASRGALPRAQRSPTALRGGQRVAGAAVCPATQWQPIGTTLPGQGGSGARRGRLQGSRNSSAEEAWCPTGTHWVWPRGPSSCPGWAGGGGSNTPGCWMYRRYQDSSGCCRHAGEPGAQQGSGRHSPRRFLRRQLPCPQS